MPADTISETVTLDRKAVMELLVEASTIADAIHTLCGVEPTPLTRALESKVERVAEAVSREFCRSLGGGRDDAR